VNQAKHNDGVTPLFISSLKGHLPVVECLIKHGADVNQARNDGVTPLLVSSQEGNLPVVQYLIKHGADVNRGNNDGTTPLSMAIYKKHSEVAKFLMRQNANIAITKAALRKLKNLELINGLDKKTLKLQKMFLAGLKN